MSSPKRTLTLGGVLCVSAAAAVRHLRHTLSSYNVNDVLDRKIFDDLLARGGGKVRIAEVKEWRMVDQNNGIGFVRHGTSFHETFSWKRCIQRAFDRTRAAKQYHRDSVTKAARCTVQSQIDEFRASFPGVQPEHVGHDQDEGERFIDLFKRYLVEAGRPTDVGYATLFGPDDVVRISNTVYKFKDREFAAGWAMYHKTHAKLIGQTAHENLRGNAGYPLGTPFVPGCIPVNG